MKSLQKAAIVIFSLFLILPASAQIDQLKDKIKIPVKPKKIPDLERLFEEEPPISTALSDAVYDIPFLDDFNPSVAADMIFLPLTPEASLTLLPGLWEGHFQSYCLMAGSYAPGEGDGYVYAPLKGKYADIVKKILKKSVLHPEIKQNDIQLLLWAILSKCKISECHPQIQKVAKALLTRKELDRLNGGAIGRIPSEVLEAALDKLPPITRDILRAEARLREILVSKVAVPYEEVERVAVLVGDVLPPPDSREIPLGRWNYHPEGFFVRYFPSGYTLIRIQIYQPEEFFLEIEQEGLIKSIADRKGRKIQIIYNQKVKPLPLSRDCNVSGIDFKELILSWPDEAGQIKTRSIKKTGWLLLGIPAQGGQLQPNQQTYFPDASERYQLALKLRDDVRRIKNALSKINPELKGLSEKDEEKVILMGNYALALRQAISSFKKDSEDEFDKVYTDFLELPYRLWMREFSVSLKQEVTLGKVSIEETKLRPASQKMPFLMSKWLNQSHFELVSFRNSQDHEMTRQLLPTWRLALDSIHIDSYYLSSIGGPYFKKSVSFMALASGSRKLKKFDPSASGAQPGNTGKQRLGQSGRKSGSGEGRKAAEKTRKAVNGFSFGTSAGTLGMGKLFKTATPFGIPKAVSGQIIGRTVNLWGECIDALSSDPPRSDYHILARPDPGTFVPVQPGEDGMTKARAEAINSFLSVAVDLTAKLRAAKFSIERYSGAMAAGDEEWAGRQIENAIKYERESGLTMMVVAEKLRSLIRIAQQEGIPDTLITPELIESYRRMIRKFGFSPEELEACRLLKLTPEEIEEMKESILGEEPLRGPISLYKIGLELADSLEDFARILLTLPVIE